MKDAGPVFPRNSEVTPIPNAFFSHVLPELQDPDELRVVLHAFFAIRCKKVFPRFVTVDELTMAEPLLAALTPDADARIQRAVQGLLTKRLLIEVEASSRRLLFINDEQGRRSATRVKAGELAVAIPPLHATEVEDAPGRRGLEDEVGVGPSDGASLPELYETNFGPLTPLIAEQIADAQQRFPAEWLPKAMKLAVTANVRRWSYVAAILERWQNEGIDVDEETGRDPERDRLWERYVRARTSR